MSRVAILPGHEYDIVSPMEMDQAFLKNEERIDAIIRDTVRGVKPMRFFGQANIPVSGVAQTVTVQSGASPRPGYVWSIVSAMIIDTANAINTAYFCRVSNSDVTPLVSSAMPNADFKYVLDTWNVSLGPAKANTYGRGQIIFNAGEFPTALCWVSAAASGGIIAINGTAVEVPAEMVGKLVI